MRKGGRERKSGIKGKKLFIKKVQLGVWLVWA
jgi:hypothetical protein